MSQFLEQTRRATQKVLQTVGIAKESSDDEEFLAAFQDYNVLTATVKEIGSDIRTLQSGLERLVNSTGSLAQHIQNSEALLSRHLSTITGGDTSACKLLETLTIQLADAQREIISGSLNKILALINNAVVPQLLKECKDDQLTASALEKRKRAHLDYDAKLRSHSAAPYQVEEARKAFDQLSATATSLLTEKAKVRTAAILSAATSVTKALRDNYDFSAGAMASSAEVAGLLGSYVGAPGAPKQPPRQPPPQRPKPAAQSQAPRQSPPPKQHSPSPAPPAASGANATFFDMLDSSEIMPSKPQPQSQPQPKPQSQSQSTFFDMLGSDSTPAQPKSQPKAQANTLDIFAQAPTTTTAAAGPASGNDLLSGWDTNSGAGGSSSASDTLADLMGGSAGGAGAQQSSGDILMPSSTPTSYGGSSAGSSSSFANMFGDLGIDLQGSGAPSAMAGAGAAAQLPPDETAVLATKEDVERWANEGGRKANLRALLSTLETVLWEGAGWKKITLADLVDPASVKNYYKKAITVVHPDKVVGARRQELARFIFAALRQSHDAFRRELEAQEAARARAQAMARGGGGGRATAGDDVD